MGVQDERQPVGLEMVIAAFPGLFCEPPTRESLMRSLDFVNDRIDAGGWPTRDRAAPEED